VDPVDSLSVVAPSHNAHSDALPASGLTAIVSGANPTNLEVTSGLSAMWLEQNRVPQIRVPGFA
jgi:hypothetical protein